MTTAALDPADILEQAADRLRAELFQLAGQLTGARLAELIAPIRRAVTRASAAERKSRPAAPEVRPWVAPATGHPAVARHYAGHHPTKPARSLGRRPPRPTRVGAQRPPGVVRKPATVQRAATPRRPARWRDRLRRLARPVVVAAVLLVLLVLLAGSAPDRDRGGGSAGCSVSDRTGAHFSLDRGDRSR